MVVLEVGAVFGSDWFRLGQGGPFLLCAHAPKERPVEVTVSSGHLHTRNWHLDLGPLVSRTVRSKCLLFKLGIDGALLRQPVQAKMVDFSDID